MVKSVHPVTQHPNKNLRVCMGMLCMQKISGLVFMLTLLSFSKIFTQRVIGQVSKTELLNA